MAKLYNEVSEERRNKVIQKLKPQDTPTQARRTMMMSSTSTPRYPEVEKQTSPEIGNLSLAWPL
jgi:hypothetical protein